VTQPDWAEWRQAETQTFTIGVEEELMLLNGDDFTLANRIEAVMPRLPEWVLAQTSEETHNSAVEICTNVVSRVSDAVGQLRDLRAELADTLFGLGLAGAGSGTHPFAVWQEVSVSEGDRHQFVHGSMRALARREPTFALHLHVGLPDPEAAIRVQNAMRVHLPLLLALSANSPYWQGRDTGLASARTPLFQAFPRVGIPRVFSDYAHYVDAVDLLVRTEAVPDPSFLWWDIRPRPATGTIEIRSMDAQSRTDDVAKLVALTQCLVRAEAIEGIASQRAIELQEAIEENRFIAARDGVQAELIDPASDRRRPVTELLSTMLDRIRPHAQELGCEEELAASVELIADPPAERQRQLHESLPSLAQVIKRLTAELA
jgi:carboxylate-amine ligase